MSRPRKILFAQIAVIVSIAPAVVSANIYGPAPGYAGVLGEMTCMSCHTNNGNDPPAGSGVKVDFPNGLTYAPGVRQHLVVTVTDSGAGTTTCDGLKKPIMVGTPSESLEDVLFDVADAKASKLHLIDLIFVTAHHNSLNWPRRVTAGGCVDRCGWR